MRQHAKQTSQGNPVLRIRSRVINFRVTDDEFARLKEASEELGARCLSDFARNVILRSAEDAAPASAQEDDARSRVVALERRIDLLEAHLLRLERSLAPARAMSAEAGS